MAHWRDENKVKLLAAGAHHSGNDLSLTGAQSNASVLQVTIPANTLEAGDVLRISSGYYFDKAGASETNTGLCYVGTDATHTNNSQVSQHSVDSTKTFSTSIINLAVDSATSLQGLAAITAGGVGEGAVASHSTNIDITATMYAEFSMSITNAGNSGQLASYSIEVIKAK